MSATNDHAATPPPHSSADRASFQRVIAAQDLRGGDIIITDQCPSGRAAVSEVTTELGRDLTPWCAVRTLTGHIIPADPDTTFTVLERRLRRPRSKSTTTPPPRPFVAPRLMSQLIALANTHHRSYRVDHLDPDPRTGKPATVLLVRWLPPGCDVMTIVQLTWYQYAERRYRFHHGFVRGYREIRRSVDGEEAIAYLTGQICLYRDRVSRP